MNKNTIYNQEQDDYLPDSSSRKRKLEISIISANFNNNSTINKQDFKNIKSYVYY